MYTTHLPYQDGETRLEGYLTCPDNTGTHPLVLIAHTWRGRDEFVISKAQALAQLGYAGFALDMFGQGILGESVEENSRLIQPFLENRQYLLQRIQAALNFTKSLPVVNTQHIAAIGFCFGGLCVLDLARSGVDIQGVVSFHGLLNRPEKKPIQKIRSKVLVLHGYNDPMASHTQILEFQKEMDASQADWQMHIYGQAMHGFTNPQANDTNLGIVYNKQAAQRSWQAMKTFLAEIFQSNKIQ